MTFDTITKALGTIHSGVPVTFKYVLTAEDFPVTFVQIKAGCGSCTVANITKSSIEPNEVIDFTVTFTPTIYGEQTKKVTLKYTEDGVTISQEFTFTATVIA